MCKRPVVARQMPGEEMDYGVHGCYDPDIVLDAEENQ